MDRQKDRKTGRQGGRQASQADGWSDRQGGREIVNEFRQLLPADSRQESIRVDRGAPSGLHRLPPHEER